jgi:hypothetical protein
MALSEEEHSKLTELEQELAAEPSLTSLSGVPAAEPNGARPGPGRRMGCSRARPR